MIKLGQKYTDTIHGFTGVATCLQKHFTGCDRVYLEILKDDEIKGSWFDVTQIVGLELSEDDNKPGGGFSTTSSKG